MKKILQATLAADRQNELTEHFMHIPKGHQYNKTETEEENSARKHSTRNISYTGQPNRQAFTENKDIMRQSGNRISDKNNCKIKTQIKKL